LTIGVNPSSTEFDPSREWQKAGKIAIWQGRMLNYFRPRAHPAHKWFETWSICLELLDLNYAGGEAAHVDVSPRPTTPMLDEGTDKIKFRAMVEHDVRWFFELLDKLTQVRLLLVAGPIPRANGRKQQLADFIREHSAKHFARWSKGNPMPRLLTPGHPKGIPVFVCPYEPKVNGLYAMIRQVYRNRELLRRLSAAERTS